MRPSDQKRHHGGGLFLLQLGQDGPEVSDVKWNEVNSEKGPAVLAEIELHPVGRDVAVVVVGRERVDRLAHVVHRPFDQGAQLLGWDDPGGEDVLVANAAFVLLVVEVELLILVDRGPHRFSRTARDPAHDHGSLGFEHQLVGVLDVLVVGGLGVKRRQLQLAAEDPALLVDVVDGEVRRVDHHRAVDVQASGAVQDAPDSDRTGVGRWRAAPARGQSDGTQGQPGPLQEPATR